PSPSEEKLWREIRGKRLGVAFRRQVVIGDFIVDFLAPSRKLVVEVDGLFHERQRSADARRDAKLGRLGYRVLRIPSSLLDRDLSEALARIREAIGRAPLTPLFLTARWCRQAGFALPGLCLDRLSFATSQASLCLRHNGSR